MRSSRRCVADTAGLSGGGAAAGSNGATPQNGAAGAAQANSGQTANVGNAQSNGGNAQQGAGRGGRGRGGRQNRPRVAIASSNATVATPPVVANAAGRAKACKIARD